MPSPMPSRRRPPAQESPRDEKRTALVVGAALVVIVAGGLLGQVAAAASSDVEVAVAGTEDIQITPDLGGPSTAPAPSPAPAPGPTVDPPSSTPPAAFIGGATVVPAVRHQADDPVVPFSDSGEGGVRIQLAPGWDLLSSDDNGLVAYKGNAVFTVDITSPPADTGALMQQHLQGLLDRGMQNLEVTDPAQVPLPSSAFVAAQRISLRGLVASQQGGTIALEGFAFHLVRQDGLGITVGGLFDEGELARTPALTKDYGTMLNTVFQTG